MVTAPFNSVQEAAEVYYGTDSDGPSDDGGTQTRQWTELDTVPTDWVAGWNLARQDARDDPDVSRYFVIRVESGTFQALTMSGTVREPAPDTPLEELPHTRDESEARSAYQKWVDQNGEQTEDSSGAWGDWQRVRQAKPWWVFARQHQERDATQFLAAGELRDGSAVYLGPDGGVRDEPHIFESVSALEEAVKAYRRKASNGEIPEDRRPTGNKPDDETVQKDGAAAAGPGPNGPGGPGGLLSSTPAKIAAATGAAGVAWYANEVGALERLGEVVQ